MQYEVSAWHSQEHASHTTDGEGDQETNGPYDRRRELNPTTETW